MLRCSNAAPSHLSGTQDVLQDLSRLRPFLLVLIQQEVLSSPFNDLTNTSTEHSDTGRNVQLHRSGVTSLIHPVLHTFYEEKHFLQDIF